MSRFALLPNDSVMAGDQCMLDQELAKLRAAVARKQEEVDVAREQTDSEIESVNRLVAELQQAANEASEATMLVKQEVPIATTAEDSEQLAKRIADEWFKVNADRDLVKQLTELVVAKEAEVSLWKGQAEEVQELVAKAMTSPAETEWQLKYEDMENQRIQADRERQQVQREIGVARKHAHQALLRRKQLSDAVAKAKRAVERARRAAEREQNPDKRAEIDALSPILSPPPLTPPSPSSANHARPLGSMSVVEAEAKLKEHGETLAEQNNTIARLEAEIEQWMSAAESLQKLVEDSVNEVAEESDSCKRQIEELMRRYERELQLRRNFEAKARDKMKELNDLLQRTKEEAGDDSASLASLLEMTAASTDGNRISNIATTISETFSNQEPI